MLAALKHNLIKSAAIDVITGEQKLNLLKNDLVKYSLRFPHKLLITPHIAGLTYQSESRAIEILMELINKKFKIK